MGRGAGGGGRAGSRAATGKPASVNVAMEIVQMQEMGAPPKHIEAMLRENGVDYVEAYHVTRVENMKNIEKNGINLSPQENRPDASYFFLDKRDVGDNANVLGHHGDYATVTIRIPRSEAANIKYDGFFNGTFSSSYSAARLYRAIPSDWIVSVTKTAK